MVVLVGSTVLVSCLVVGSVVVVGCMVAVVVEWVVEVGSVTVALVG